MDGEGSGTPATDYLAAIDGAGQEDLFYGYVNDNLPTPPEEVEYLLSFLQLYEENGVEVLVTDYCSEPAKMDDSYARSSALGFISIAADHRELDNVPAYPATPHDAHDADVTTLAGARNFLYLLNSERFADRESYVLGLDQTNYDLLIVDLYYQDVMLTATEITDLKSKPGGGQRLLLCYLSIGQVEDYRDYWQPGWSADPPSWLLGADPEWPGNYDVHYWHADWQAILFGADGSYMQKIIDAGFDGVYLDKIDAFENFE